MKNEDILKTIAILSGYDRNITFDKWRLEDSPGEWCYEMTAENDKEECISICEPGLAMAISQLLEEIYGNCDTPVYCIGETPKYFLDDNWRKEQLERQKRIDEENKEYIRKTKPASDWWKENNPCPKCEINKKDHWDDIHYNCELCHAQRCPILKEAHKKYDVIFKKCLNSCHKKL